MVKTTAPKIEDRPEQHYVGIRMSTPMNKLPEVIPQLIDEVFGWLNQHGIAPEGPPIHRFHIIDMDNELDIEIGVLVAAPVKGDNRIKAGVIPAGRYATLVYTGVENGIAGNRVLIEWGNENKLKWDTYASDKGDGFVSRVEYFIDGPEDDPDPANWRTEVVIKLVD